MEEAKIKRLKELREKDRTEDETCELEALEYEWGLEIFRRIPLPTCCKAAQMYPAVLFSQSVYEGDSREKEGRWEAALSESMRRDMFRLHGIDQFDWFRNRPAAEFCPFCGEKLPKMRRKKTFPEMTCVVTDGGYYCDTCQQRLSQCRCYPSEHAWEPDTSEGGTT